MAPAKEESKKSPAKPAEHARAQKGAKARRMRTNKKAEVLAMIKRAKGAMLAEIMEATGWQAHTVRGSVSILGSKAGEKIESAKNAAAERTYRIGKWHIGPFVRNAAFGSQPGRRPYFFASLGGELISR